MTLKSNLNFEEKLNPCLKNDAMNLVKLNVSSGKSENLLFCKKQVMFELQKYRGVVS